METTDILDVTVIEPRFKHPTIFQKFDSLLPGQGFVIHNDHDPKPLYYQLLGERGDIFTWEYQQSGPDVWKVKIALKGEKGAEETVGELVTKDYRKAQVFKKYGIDFCCGGKKTLSEVSEKKGINLDDLKADLRAVEKQESGSSVNFDKWELDFLSDYITNTHHQYIKDNIPFISELSQKVAKVHGSDHPEAVQIAAIFARTAQDLSLHLVKEEKILFPFIKELVAAKRDKAGLPNSNFGEVANPIDMMETEHEQAGEDMAEIKALSDNYQVPADACTSYRLLYQKLEEFENDLHKHVHLENNILFPKALALEKELV